MRLVCCLLLCFALLHLFATFATLATFVFRNACNCCCFCRSLSPNLEKGALALVYALGLLCFALFCTFATFCNFATFATFAFCNFCNFCSFCYLFTFAHLYRQISRKVSWSLLHVCLQLLQLSPLVFCLCNFCNFCNFWNFCYFCKSLSSNLEKGAPELVYALGLLSS